MCWNRPKSRFPHGRGGIRCFECTAAAAGACCLRATLLLPSPAQGAAQSPLQFRATLCLRQEKPCVCSAQLPAATPKAQRPPPSPAHPAAMQTTRWSGSSSTNGTTISSSRREKRET